MTTSDERMFATFRRGQIRDERILREFRNHLRGLTDPDTGATFTEDKITQITQRGSRFYLEADAIDIVMLAMQNRARWLANQQRPKWSNTDFLDNIHGPLWLGEDSRLPAIGGSGTVTATAAAGAVFPGSTVIGSPTAAVATWNGLQFQVLTTATVPIGSTTVTLSMQCVDTGDHTNPAAAETFEWDANYPASAELQFPVLTTFTGGLDEETDAEFADRIEQIMRYRPACGNNAHVVAWARESNVAVETAFVYACAWHAGSVLVCVTQKRGTTEGPNARTDVSPGTLIAVRNYLVPPASSVMPERAYVVVVPPNEQPADLVARLSMSYGTTGGWADVNPWPTYSASTYPAGVVVASIVSPTEFTVTTDSDLPGGAASLTGADAPQLMVWDEDNSEFVELDVQTVTDGGTTVTIELNSAPSGYTIATGDILSPYTDRHSIIAQGLTNYFDTLGPGEVVDLDTDPRGARAFRYPSPSQQYPSRAGEAVITWLLEELGGVAPDISLPYISRNTPDLPGDIVDGPNIVTLGEVGVYPL